MPEERTRRHLTPKGWIEQEEGRPDGTVATIVVHEQDKMYATSYLSEEWVSDDGEAVKALLRQFPSGPRISSLGVMSRLWGLERAARKEARLAKP